MNITRLTLWHVPLTSHLAYNMADGKICDTVTTSVLRLEADNGQAGWGEVCPIPHYLPAYAGGVAPALAELAPVIFARDGSALGAEAMMRAADRHLIGHVYAKSALDIALWDRRRGWRACRCTGFSAGCRRRACRFTIPFPASIRTRCGGSPSRRRRAASRRSR